MRRDPVEELMLRDRQLLKDDVATCAVCGAELDRDDESHTYSCPVCDALE